MYRLIYAFDHLPLGAVGCSTPYLGPANIGYLINATMGRLDLINYAGRNALSLNNTPTTSQDRSLWIDLRELGIVFEKRVIIGYKWWIGKYTGNPVLIGPNNWSYPPTVGNATVSVTGKDLFIYPYGYVEVVLDFDARTTTVFVNGVQKIFTQNTQARQDYIAQQTKAVAWTQPYEPSDLVGIMVGDFYVRDSVGETDPIKPLGSPVFSPVTLESVDAVGFTPATGNTLVGTLTAKALPAAVQPQITAPDSLVDATVNAVLKVTPVVGRYPAALQLFAQSAGAKINGAVVSLKHNGVPVSPNNVDALPVHASVNYVAKLGVYHKTQDGSSMSWDKINAAAVSIKYT